MAKSDETSIPTSIGLLTLALLLSLGSSDILHAAEGGGLGSDRQGFRLTYFGADAGEEWFQVTRDPDRPGLSVTAEATGTLAGRSVEMRQQLQVDPDSYTLLRYELTALVGKETQTIRAVRRADSVSVFIEAGGRKLRRSYYEPGELFVLDNLLANHLVLLGRRIAADRFVGGEVRVVVPQVGSIFPAKIVPKPPDESGKRLVEITIAGVTELLEFDADGSLSSVEVSTQGIRYARIGVEEPTGAAGSGKTGTETKRSPGSGKKGARIDESVPEQPTSPTRLLYKEEVVRFTTGKISLDGILTLPRGGQQIPYPAVLFVHGSGPLDRDETIGGNRPFMELARGLAVYGIASFRYDKRTLAAPETIDPIRVTVEEEVIKDAVRAFQTLRTQGGIAEDRLLILGHSLGGGLAAAIAKRATPVSGLILLAASPRPLDELIRDQILYIRDLAGGSSDAAAATILSQIDSLRAGTLPPERLVLGMSGYYLNDYNRRDLASDLLAFPNPVLILQGGKDYQVTETDLDLWKEIAAKGPKTNIRFRLFPDLGHLFIPIEGDPTPTKVMQAGTVDPGVIREIADFIGSLR